MRIVSTTLLLLLIGSCQWSENRHITRKVAAAEVAGHWVATPFAMESLRYAGHREHLNPSDHQIEIRADGTCTFQSVLNIDLNGSGGDALYTREMESCRWRLLDFTKHSEIWIGLDQHDTGQTYYSFAEEEGRLFMWRYAGDPDAWKYMEFTRRDG